MRSLGQALIQYDWCHIRRGKCHVETETHKGRMPCDNRDRDLSSAEIREEYQELLATISARQR